MVVMNYDGDPTSRDGQTGLWMRVAGLLFPVLFVLQGIMVSSGSLPQDHYLGLVPFLVTSVLFLGTAVFSVLVPISFRPGIYVRTFGLQLFGLILVSITTGFATPLAVIIALMLYDSFRLLGISGLTVSSLMLFLAVAIDIYRGINIQDSNIASTLIMAVSIILFIIVILYVLQTQIVRQSALENSRIQEELQRFRMVTLVNNLRDGIIGTDENGVIRIYNAAALNILDTNDSLNGRNISEVLIVKDESGKKVNVYNILKKSRHLNSDDLFYHYNDETVRLSITASELQSGRAGGEKLDIDGGFILILRDVTKQKNLDDERDEFISVVSHELRTPLTIAEGTLSNLQLLFQKHSSDRHRIEKSITAAHDQILFLSKMVNDLSTLSRAERGVADTPEKVEVKELITGLYHEHMPQARSANLTFDMDISHHLEPIFVSRLYISELLQNLITNAIKYTKEGGITLTATQHKGYVTFCVKDTGIGISKSEQAKVYNKFYRSEDYRTRETRGTGLGLYVSTKLARKMNTFIRLHSRLNVGSEFSFDIDNTKK